MNTRIKKLDDFGRGIAFIEDKITFIPYVLDNELVECEIVLKKKKYNQARMLSILQKNENRVEAKCPYFFICGGCYLQHMNTVLEKQFKKDKVIHILKKFAGIELSNLDFVEGDYYFYRNKITLTVENGKMGLLREKSNKLVEIDHCGLIHEQLNDLIKVLRDLVKKEMGVSKIMLRLGQRTNEVMIAISGKVEHIDDFLAISDSLIINQKVISKKYITSYIMDKKFCIGASSFFQVNDQVVEILYQEVINQIKYLNSERVLDLYCGVGTIGISIASYVKSVIGVEVVEEAIEAANYNKKINGIKNISFLHSRVEDVLDLLPTNYDTIIIDPPRSGLDRKTRNFLIKVKSKYLIYISCDPVTLARDLNDLKRRYLLSSIKVFNMFPRTYHVECVVLLSLRK